jgi:hypothetical protein
MGWALVAIVILGVGVPIAAWAFTRRHPPAAPNRLGTAYDQIDKWLLKQHRLAPLDRERVRKVVAQGRQPDDPALAAAAHDLASKVLAGRLGRLWLARILGAANMIMGAAFIGWGITGIAASSHVDGYVILIPEGAWFVFLGTLLGVWAPKRIRRRAAAYLAANAAPPPGPHER